MKTVKLDRHNLQETLDSIETRAKTASQSPHFSLHLRLLTEEAITAFQSKEKATIHLHCKETKEGFTIELQQEGAPFDPTHEQDALHVRLLLALSDSLEYRREKNANILTLKKMR